MRRSRVPLGIAAMGAAVAGTGGCVSARLQPESITGAELRAIHGAFAEAIERARRDPGTEWHSGWVGNMWVNFVGGDNAGLCYQWQEFVYDAVAPTVHGQGWDLTGITINNGGSAEHHAVVVFDPRVVSRDGLLGTGASHGYVLDAWRRGRADIYPLGEWVRLPPVVRVPAALEDVPAPTVWPEMRAGQ